MYSGVNNGEETTSTKTDFNFRINQNRILILEIAHFLNLLPKNKNKMQNKNKPKKNDVKNDVRNDEVEKEVESVQNELKDLFLSGWKVEELLNIVSEKMVKKGMHVLFVFLLLLPQFKVIVICFFYF